MFPQLKKVLMGNKETGNLKLLWTGQHSINKSYANNDCIEFILLVKTPFWSGGNEHR